VETSALLSQEEILHLTSLRELFGAFAHEISQPLNAIMIAAQVLQLRIQRSSLSEEEKTSLVARLGVVLSQVQRAGGIVDEVRSLSRRVGLEESAKPHTSALVDKVHGLVGQQFMGRGINLTKNCSAIQATVTVDPRVVEWSLVQCLAFARDSVESIGAWHGRNEIAFNKAVTVNCTAGSGASLVRVEWGIGKLSGDQVADLVRPSRHAGLNAASSVMKSLGGNLECSPSCLLLSIP